MIAANLGRKSNDRLASWKKPNYGRIMELAQTYARPALEVARDHIGDLLTAYEQATGFPPSFACKIARGDPKFASTYREVGFGFRSYDVFVGRMSAIWPDGVEWPSSVPRQAPAEIDPDAQAALDARMGLVTPPPDGPGLDDIPAAAGR